MPGRSSRGRRGKLTERSEIVTEANEMVADVMLIVQRRFLETQLEILEDLAEVTRRRLERIKESDLPRASRSESFARRTARSASEKIPVGDDCGEGGDDTAADHVPDRQKVDGTSIDNRSAAEILTGRDPAYHSGRRAPGTSA